MAYYLQSRRQRLAPSTGGALLTRPRIESDDIIIDILSRLPVKSLIRFRCVCKSWYALISDSHLVKKHLGRAVTGMNANSFRLLVSDNPLQSIDYEALNDVSSAAAIRVRRLQLPVMVDSITFLGSCNGLICLRGNQKGDIILWNPCTRDTNMLPGVTSLPSNPMFYGFGYDSTLEDYKVILGGTFEIAGGLLTTTITVFTLKTGSWRTVHDLDHVKLNGKGCLLNGALHWVEFEWKGPVLSSRIISFDLAEEKFQETVPLSYLTDQRYTSVRIGTARNCLFLYIFHSSDISDVAITIWEMKQYGVRESWAKIIQIPYKLLSQLQVLNLICILENGEALMSCDLRYLVSYNPQKDTIRNVLENPAILLTEAIVYVETLVSPITGSGADI